VNILWEDDFSVILSELALQGFYGNGLSWPSLICTIVDFIMFVPYSMSLDLATCRTLTQAHVSTDVRSGALSSKARKQPLTVAMVYIESEAVQLVLGAFRLLHIEQDQDLLGGIENASRPNIRSRTTILLTRKLSRSTSPRRE
jgi:hypothetical protein